jgi:hypothetical protein
MQQGFHLRQAEVRVLLHQLPQRRDTDAPELVASTVFARGSFEKTLEVGGVDGVGELGEVVLECGVQGDTLQKYSLFPNP